jgi:hypothetical protein
VHAELPRPAPFPLPPPAKPDLKLPVPPVPPKKPDWLKRGDPSIEEDRLPRTGLLGALGGDGESDWLRGGIGTDRLDDKAFAALREMEESMQWANDALAKWKENTRPLQNAVDLAMRPLSSPEVTQAKGALDELGARLDELDFDWAQTFDGMSDVMLDFAETGKFEWRDLAKVALDSIEDMLQGWLKLQQQKMGQGGESDPWSVILNTAGSALGGLFGGGGVPAGTPTAATTSGFSTLTSRAAGGPVLPFTPFLVGEKGPELFVPRIPGEIVPNHALGASRPGEPPVVVHQHLNVMPGVPEAVRREVTAMLPQIAQAARGAVLNDLDRNNAVRKRIG